jgi:hypothetical protein
MDNFQSILGDAAGNALCNVLTVAGASAPLLFAISLRGGGAGTGTAAAVAGLAGVAANYGCNYDPDSPPALPPNGYTGCSKYDNGYGIMSAIETDGVRRDQFSFLEITNFTVEPTPEGYAGDDVRYVFDFINLEGEARRERFFPVPTARRAFETRPSIPDDTCNTPAPPFTPAPPPPYIHTDTASGCSIEVNFQGWAVGGGGMTGPVFEMKPASGTFNARNAVGGCNFLPTIHYSTGGSGGGDGGPVSFPVPDPVPPDGPEPWWAAPLRGALQGAAQAAAAAAIEGLTEAEYPEDNYALRGVCELDPDGNPIDVTRSTNWPAGAFPAAVLNRLDALATMFQFDKDLRQPTCLPTSNQPGDPVTINFRSVQRTLTGADQARKRFVYFDQVNSTLDATVAHWRDFTWNAGPLIVNCFETPLGKPQVWAESLDEAKRVFAHAAAIAGVDLSTARYETSTSKNPRYGFSGQMVVDRSADGILGITKRQGPSGLPDGLP